MAFPTGHYSRSTSVAVGDLNNDTHLDVVVANYDTHNISIFLGRGDGNFTSPRTFSTGAFRPVSLALGDVNSDHRLDIIIANNGTNGIGIFFGDGNGSFTYHMTYSVDYNSTPLCVVVADLNNDHHFDIVLTDQSTDYLGIFLG